MGNLPTLPLPIRARTADRSHALRECLSLTVASPNLAIRLVGMTCGLVEPACGDMALAIPFICAYVSATWALRVAFP